ncbi:MAG: ParA family protein, partial [Kiritimatiellia bacterium]|nr:ParA family protein [Kiritimatiellia bacterium]
MTRILALANQKGGVGKTTTALNLAAGLVERRLRVLLVDLDPQANATSGLGHEKTPGGSLYQALLSGGDIRSLIQPTDYKRFDLLPSETDLAAAEMDLAGAEDAVHRAARLLEPIRAEGSYDAILIDCPPSLGLLTMNALMAADGVLIPLQCEYYALEGLSVMVDVIRRVRESGGNPRLELDGIVMTMFTNRTKLAQQVVQEVVRHFGDKVYPTLIPRNVRLGEAPSYGKPVMAYDKKCTGAIAYRRLAIEFMQRNHLGPARPAPEPPAPVP